MEKQFIEFLKGYMAEHGLEYMDEKTILENYPDEYPDFSNLEEPDPSNYENGTNDEEYIEDLKQYKEDLEEAMDQIYTFVHNVEEIISLAVEKKSKVNNKIIIDYNNDSGNLTVTIDEPNEDGNTELEAFFGFEYYAYFQDESYLKSSMEFLKSIQWN